MRHVRARCFLAEAKLNAAGTLADRLRNLDSFALKPEGGIQAAVYIVDALEAAAWGAGHSRRLWERAFEGCKPWRWPLSPGAWPG